jgi:hypothetical protein
MISIIVAFSISLTNQEQLIVELINRARSSPAAEAALYGMDLNDGLQPGTLSSAAKQPLAPHQALVDAARAHSQEMLSNNHFSHTNLAGQSPTARAKAAGYPSCVSENIAWGGSCQAIDLDTHVYLRHKQLFLSPSHRKNMLTPRFREIGAGIEAGAFTPPGKEIGQNASMMTEMFSHRNSNTFITGVVFADVIVKDNFYTIGEGAADVSITAVPIGRSASYTVTTGPSGGYSLMVPAGSYTVTASGDSIGAIIMNDVVMDDQNVKLDFDTSNPKSSSKSSDIQIIDDGDKGYTIAGSWTGNGSDGYGADSLFASSGSSNLAAWAFQVSPGRYRVSATWPNHDSGAAVARFTIRDGCLPLATVDINQEQASYGFGDAETQWTDLGDSYEITSTMLVVRLSGSENGCVVADAIRIERLSEERENE